MKKTKIVTLSILAILSACSFPNPGQINDKQGTLKANKDNLNIQGVVEFPQPKEFSTKATIIDVQSSATVALLYPPDHSTNANETIATGLSKANGSFSLNPGAGFTPSAGDIYVLEATKRIGNAGKAKMSVRTYLRWNGTSWQSITNPGIRLSKNTTALTIIDARDSSISASEMIGCMVNNTVATVGTVSATTINQVSGMVEFLLTADVDPAKFIDYQNSEYFFSREISLQKSHLIANKECRNCDLQREDLRNINISSGDLTNANLNSADLSGANLTGVNLSGVTLTDANITNTTLSNATWIDGNRICGNGSVGGCFYPDLLVNTYTTNIQSTPNIAMDDDGDFVITWSSNNQDGYGYGIYAQRYGSNGEKIGSEFQVNTYTSRNQSVPNIAMDTDGDFVISWRSGFQDGSFDGIYAQRYSSNGSVSGSEFRVNTYTSGSQINPSVAMNTDGDFIIAWASNFQDGDSYGIYAQRYNSEGVPQGSEFRLNPYTTGNQTNPSVAMDIDGDFVVTWSGRGSGDGTGIYFQRYNSSGSPVGSQSLVNTYTTNNQSNPIVAMDADGDFVINWTSTSIIPNGTNYTEIYAQRYYSDGNKVGSEFRVNSHIVTKKRYSDISMNTDGKFVMVWGSSDQDANAPSTFGYGIYAQRYNSTGEKIGSEFRVNTYTTKNQKFPSVTMDNAGDFVVTWASYNQDGNGYGVYLKRYDSNGQDR